MPETPVPPPPVAPEAGSPAGTPPPPPPGPAVVSGPIEDAFLLDLQTGSMRLVSEPPTGGAANGRTTDVDVSAVRIPV